MTPDGIRELLAYHRWAHRAWIEALRALPPEVLDRPLASSFPSIRATFAHMVGAELIWVGRWEGGDGALPEGFEELELEALVEALEGVARRQDAVVAGLLEGEEPGAHGAGGLERELAYGDRAGNPHRSTFREMIQHVVNHATYHRGQLATLFRQVGVIPPSTDLIKYTRRPG